MRRYGLPAGVAPSTVALWNFRAGEELIDASGGGGTLVLAGAGAAPTYGGPPFGDAVAVVGGGQYLQTATGPDVTGAMTLDAWVVPTAAVGYAVTKDWAAAPYASLDWDGGGAGTYWPRFKISDGLSSPYVIGLHHLTPGRLHHLRGVYVPSTSLSLYVDGVLSGYSEDGVLAAIGSSTTWEIGRSMTGSVANVRIRNVADLDAATCSPNLDPGYRVGRRAYVFYRAALGEEVQADAWAADGDHYRLDVDTTDLLAGVADVEDLHSVASTTAAGDAPVTWERRDSPADLAVAGGINQWAYDPVTRRLWATEDPTGYDSFMVRCWRRWGERGRRDGERWWSEALIEAGPMRRAVSELYRPWRTGDGGSVTLARGHADVPSLDIVGAGIVWEGAPAEVEQLGHGQAWTEARRLLTGQTEDVAGDADTVRAEVRPLMARLHKQAASAGAATPDEFPDIPDAMEGAALWIVLGLNHVNVGPIACIDRNPVAGRWLYQIAPTDFPLAKIHRVYADRRAPVGMVQVDLNQGGRFWSPADPALGRLYCDVDGLSVGPPAMVSPAGVVVAAWGDSLDAAISVEDQLQAMLARYLPGVGFDATWAVTASRVGVRLRSVGAGANESAVTSWLARTRDASLAFAFERADGSLAWRDVVKADAAVAVRPSDVLGVIEWEEDAEDVARRVECEALTYTVTAGGELLRTRTAGLDLRGLSRTRRQRLRELGDLGYYTVDAAELILAAARGFFERPTRRGRALVVGRLANVDLLDAIDLDASLVDAGAETRMRVVSVAPQDDATELRFVEETNFPADGTSGSATRAAMPWATLFRWGDSTPAALADTGGAWLPVADDAWQAFDAALFPAAVRALSSHRFAARAIRVGGTGLFFRLTAVDAYGVGFSDEVAFELTVSHGAAWGIQEVAAVPALPTPVGGASSEPRLLLCLEYRTTGGSTGSVSSASWECGESAPDEWEQMPIHLDAASHHEPGVAVTSYPQHAEGNIQVGTLRKLALSESMSPPGLMLTTRWDVEAGAGGIASPQLRSGYFTRMERYFFFPGGGLEIRFRNPGYTLVSGSSLLGPQARTLIGHTLDGWHRGPLFDAQPFEAYRHRDGGVLHYGMARYVQHTADPARYLLQMLAHRGCVSAGLAQVAGARYTYDWSVPLAGSGGAFVAVDGGATLKIGAFAPPAADDETLWRIGFVGAYHAGAGGAAPRLRVYDVDGAAVVAGPVTLEPIGGSGFVGARFYTVTPAFPVATSELQIQYEYDGLADLFEYAAAGFWVNRYRRLPT